MIKIFHVSFSKHCEDNISDFPNLINISIQNKRFSFLKDIHMTNDKNNNFNAQKTWGYQIWTVDTSKAVDQLEIYSIATDRVILLFLLTLRMCYGYQILTPGLLRNVIDNLSVSKLQNISISKIKPFSCFNTVLFHRDWDDFRNIMCHCCAGVWIFLLKYFCKSLILLNFPLKAICIHIPIQKPIRIIQEINQGKANWNLLVTVKALEKWWKMLFFSPSELFSFSRYFNFCLDFFAWLER